MTYRIPAEGEPINPEVQAALDALSKPPTSPTKPKPERPGPFATPVERTEHHLERIASALESIAACLDVSAGASGCCCS